jgi:hypothetical protein
MGFLKSRCYLKVHSFSSASSSVARQLYRAALEPLVEAVSDFQIARSHLDGY